jgi:hypothetical protein
VAASDAIASVVAAVARLRELTLATRAVCDNLAGRGRAAEDREGRTPVSKAEREAALERLVASIRAGKRALRLAHALGVGEHPDVRPVVDALYSAFDEEQRLRVFFFVLDSSPAELEAYARGTHDDVTPATAFARAPV